MDSTDFLSLGKHKIVESVKAGLPGNISKALNVLTVKDNVLFTWDFHSHCVLTLNIKAARENEQNNAVICQKLLPVRPPVFSPEKIVVNDSGSLLAVAGPNGVLVFELPTRCPPYGSFNNNKELVYCRTHCLDERLFACSDTVEILQVKFHPGSVKDNHILILTSDNALRLYQIEDDAINVRVFSVGETPMAKVPCSRITFLGALGEIAVDFDFGTPEICDVDDGRKREVISREVPDDVVENEGDAERSLVKIHDPVTNTDTVVTVHMPDKGRKERNMREKENYSNFNWPIYLLSGDFIINVVNIPLYEKSGFSISGPLPMMPSGMFQCDKRACSIICLNCSPQIVCVASTNGEIIQGVVVSMDEEETENPINVSKKRNSSKEIYFFEAVDIELGLTTTLSSQEESYTCPVFLHQDESRCDRYFATHSTGVHLITINCLEDIQRFVNSEDYSVTDVFSVSSTAEYLVCTKTSSNKSFNPVIGFALYYNPSSIITLLANGSLLTLALVTTGIVPKLEKLSLESQTEMASSPMKEMLKMPFDHYIHNLLKKADSHPIMSLSKNEERSLKECHELVQKTAQIFREKFKCHMTVKDEIEKRARALETLKDFQLTELERMRKEKQHLQENAESLAEKYEDIREKQENILRRCAKLLMQFSMKKEILSDAEEEYLSNLGEIRKKLDRCDTAIDKLIVKKNYQENQMRNWKNQQEKKSFAIGETHSNTIKTNLVLTSSRIEEMIKLVKTMKKQLQLN